MIPWQGRWHQSWSRAPRRTFWSRGRRCTSRGHWNRPSQSGRCHWRGCKRGSSFVSRERGCGWGWRGNYLVEVLGGGGNGAAELGCRNGVAAVAILPSALVESLMDATIGALRVDSEAVVAVHGRDGGVWA